MYYYDNIYSIETLFTHEFSTGRLAYNVEQCLLNHFKQYKYIGPNLLESGNTELLTLNILNTITELCSCIPHNATIAQIETIMETLNVI